MLFLLRLFTSHHLNYIEVWWNFQVGIIANKQFIKSIQNKNKQDLSNVWKLNKLLFVIELDGTRYWNATGLPCPDRIVLNKGSILQVSGANGFGKSTLMEHFCCHQYQNRLCIKNVVAYGDNNIQVAVKHTIKALEDALTNGYELILDEPVNNLTRIKLLKT